MTPSCIQRRGARPAVTWFVLLCWGFVCLPCASAKLTVVYPLSETLDERQQYPLKVLALALQKAGVDYSLRPSERVMAQSRALSQLSVGGDVTVVWTMTSIEREKTFLPIRIPLEKGLLGWRIFLIHQKNASKFAVIKTLDDLKTYEAGQGHDWPDTEILRFNGLKVQGSSNFDGIFKMLESGRIDYFPRSMLEVWAEIRNHPDMNLQVEETIILQYPTAQYFFVNKDNTVLAHLIESGLRIALKDGSFDKLFSEEYGNAIKRVNLKSRMHFRIANPLLPRETPLQDQRLWFND